MPYIQQITIDRATGQVKKELEKAIKRAGRVWNIVQIMSLNGRVMKSSMEMYGATSRIALVAPTARNAGGGRQQGQRLRPTIACA